MNKPLNTFQIVEADCLGKSVGIGQTILIYACCTSFYVLSAVYCLSFFSEDILKKYHLFGAIGFIFVIITSFLLNYLLAHRKHSDSFFSHRYFIIISYALMTIAYVFCSEIFFYHNLDNTGKLAEFALKSNLALIAITSCFLYLFLWVFDNSRWSVSEKQRYLKQKNSNYSLFFVFVTLLLIIPIISFGVPQIYKDHLEKETLSDMKSAITSETQHIENWLEEKREIGSAVLNSPFFHQNFEKWQYSQNTYARKNIQAFLESFRETQQYKSIKLIDVNGKELLSLGKNLKLEKHYQKTLLNMMNNPDIKIIRHDIYSQGTSRFEIVIPYILTNRMQEVVGAVLINFDPENYLSHYFGHWIASHQGKEVVFIRKDGDRIATMTIGTGEENLTKVIHTTMKNSDIFYQMEQSPHAGYGIGKDYNHNKMFASWNNINNTDWKIIFKSDYDKAIQSLQNSAFGISVIIFFALLILSLISLMIWRMIRRNRKLPQNTAEEELFNDFYKTSFLDMESLMSEKNSLKKCHDKLCEILGYTKEELASKSWQDINLYPHSEAEKNSLNNFRNGLSDEYRTEKELICKNDDIALLDIHLRCIRNPDQTPHYYIATLEDITQKRKSEKQLSRLSELNNIRSHCSYAIARCRNEQELFHNMCSIIVRHSNVKIAWVGLIDEHNNKLTTAAQYGEEPVSLEEIGISVDEDDPKGHGTVGKSVRTNLPCWNQDYLNDLLCTPWHNLSFQYHVQSVASVPLHQNGKIIGVFLMVSEQLNAFDPSVQDLIIEIANDIDFALENFVRETFRIKAEQELRHLYVESKVAEAEIKRLNQLYAILGYCNQAVARCTTQDELFKQICQIVTQYGAMSVAWIGLINDERKIYPVTSEGVSLYEISQTLEILRQTDQMMKQGLSRQTLTKGKPIWIQDYNNDPFCEVLRTKTPWKNVGERLNIQAMASLPLHKNGQVIGTLTLNASESFAFDIAAQKLLQEMITSINFALDNFERKEQLQLSAQVFTQSHEGLMLLDHFGKIVMVNKAFAKITGYSEQEALGQNPRILSSDKQDKEFYAAMWDWIHKNGSWQGEIWNKRKDGTLYPEWLSIQTMKDTNGRLTHYTGIFIDLTERKKTEEKVQWLAHFDPLTSLPNRTLLRERSNLSISLAQRRNEPLALMFMDLDGFKNVNDSLGHNIGDVLLKQFADRLKKIVREQDTISRQGGDEFVLVLPNTDSSGATNIAEKLLAIASEPYNIDPHELNLTASIGIAMFPSDGSDFDALSCSADTAMYRTKHNGRNNYCFFTTEMQARSTRTLELDSALRRALERNQFYLNYQPLMSLQDDTVMGFESLIRWKHPQLGLISPDEFIPVAESNGQIIPIGEWILRTVVKQIRKWIDQGHNSIVVSVNLSAIQFKDRRLTEMVSSILKETGVSPHHLILELTESVTMNKPDMAITVINSLKQRGINISIDDFGTGYSSLAYLKRFNVRSLKIDGSFIRDIPDDQENMAIVNAIMSLAKNLGIRTVAEGVETIEQVNFLKENGCTAIQGHYIAAPLSAEDADKFLLSKMSGVCKTG